MTGRVIGLYVAPAAGAPVVSRTWVDVLPGTGIAGDRYARGLGHWSDPQWPDQELTMIEAEVAEDLSLEPGTLRRNVVTRDVRLDALIGARFWMGDAELEGVRPCDPCRYLETLTRPGVTRALVGRGGLRARVVTPGRIHVGDAVVLVPADR